REVGRSDEGEGAGWMVPVARSDGGAGQDVRRREHPSHGRSYERVVDVARRGRTWSAGTGQVVARTWSSSSARVHPLFIRARPGAGGSGSPRVCLPALPPPPRTGPSP